MADGEVTEDLEEQYNDLFAYRYTERDEDYMQTISKPIPQCPCITGYFTRSKRNFDNRDNRNQGGHRGRGCWQGRGNSYRDDRGHNQGYGYSDRGQDRGQRYGDRDDRGQDRGQRYGDRDDRGQDRGQRYGDRDDRGQGHYGKYNEDRHGNRHKRYNPY